MVLYADCPGLNKRADHVEAHVADAIAGFVSSPIMERLVGEQAEGLLATRQEEDGTELARIEKKLAKLDDGLMDWANAFRDGKLTELQFTKVSGQWQTEYDELALQRDGIAQRMQSGDTDRDAMDRVRGALTEFAQTWQQLPVQRRRDILLELVESMTLERAGDRLMLRIKLKFLPEQTCTMLARAPRPEAGPESLNDRELALLKLLGDGLTHDQIVQDWCIADGGTYVMLSKAKRKLGTRDTKAAIEAARPTIEAAGSRLPLHGRVRARTRAKALTDRKLEILEQAAKGKSYGEIGQALGITYKTVNVGMHTIRKFLGVKTNDEAIAWFENRQQQVEKAERTDA